MTEPALMEPRGGRLDDADELLFRQVHPTFVQAGRPTSAAFVPSKKDAGMLSVTRGSLVSAEAAWNLHTTGKGLASAGVWAVTVGECSALPLPCYADPEPGPPVDDAHSVVDFRGLSRGVAEARGKALSRLAADRGCCFSPPAPR